MKKKYSLWAILLMFVVGCAAGEKASAPAPGETLLWSSEETRPKWTIEEPEIDGDIMMFVGVSDRYATEAGARDDAIRKATNSIVKYLGTMAKDKYEKVVTSFGLDSSVVDPTASTRQYQKQLSANVAKKVKAKKWYLEKWNTSTGVGWKVFSLATVPVEAVNDSFKKTAEQNMLEAQRKAKEAADAIAKKQAEKAAEFWKDMTEQGVVE
jgi:hypothetical protein